MRRFITRPATRSDWHERQVAFWRGMAPSYSTLYGSKWSRLEDLEIGNLLSALVSSDCVVADLGCGQGLGLRLLQEFVPPPVRYVGIDFSPEMLRHTGNAASTSAGFVIADMTALPLLDGVVDVAISLFSSVSYVIEPAGAVQELARVLRPGGLFLVMCLSRWSLRRLIRLKMGGVEQYGTGHMRNSPAALLAPVTVMSTRTVTSLAARAGLHVDGLYGQSVLSLTCASERLWRLSRSIGDRVPDLGHALVIWGHKE